MPGGRPDRAHPQEASAVGACGLPQLRPPVRPRARTEAVRGGFIPVFGRGWRSALRVRMTAPTARASRRRPRGACRSTRPGIPRPCALRCGRRPPRKRRYDLRRARRRGAGRRTLRAGVAHGRGAPRLPRGAAAGPYGPHARTPDPAGGPCGGLSRGAADRRGEREPTASPRPFSTATTGCGRSSPARAGPSTAGCRVCARLWHPPRDRRVPVANVRGCAVSSTSSGVRAATGLASICRGGEMSLVDETGALDPTKRSSCRRSAKHDGYEYLNEHTRPMKRNLSLVRALCLTAGAATAQTGREWQDPAINEINRLPMRAAFDAGERLSLDGVWRFDWVRDAGERPEGIWRTDYDDKAWGRMPVPGMWELNGYGTRSMSTWATPGAATTPTIRPWCPRPRTTWAPTAALSPCRPHGRASRSPFRSARPRPTSTCGSTASSWLQRGQQARGRLRRDEVRAPGREPHRPADVPLVGRHLPRGPGLLALLGIARGVALTARDRAHLQDIHITPALDADYRDGVLRVEMQTTPQVKGLVVRLLDAAGDAVPARR